ncbi:MAG: LysM peptidoglycan-binding domain-containing protein [Gammaproteobacteria bacterium]
MRLPISGRLSGTPARTICLALSVSVTSLSGCSLIRTEDPSVASQPAVIVTPPPVAPETARVETITKTKLELSANILEEIKTAGKPVAANLLTRIRDDLSLPYVEEPTTARELAWYASHPDYLDRVFRRSSRYIFFIVEELERRDMPLDLALLPVIESAYDPFAYSHGRAAGLWQIIPGTGRHLGLKQNWWFDGRRDIPESTRAALDYLENLHDRFDGDWLLAVAAYNSGEGNVSSAIRRARNEGDATDFWHIRRHLPVETRTYVPRLLAMSALVSSPDNYNLMLPELDNEPYFDVVATAGQIDMALAANLAGISIDDLYSLNPGVNRWATDPEGPHRLLVPVENAAPLREALAGLNDRERVEWSRHEVRSGQTLGQIADRYRTTTAVLREVNGIAGTLIRVGQQLMIPHAVEDLDAYTQSVEARLERRQSQDREGVRRMHSVRAGESLWGISQAYGVGVRDLATWNSMAPGDVLSVDRQLVVWTTPGVVISPAVATRTMPAANERIRRINYVVRRGDSLARISSRFKVTIADLLKWNNVSVDDYLQPGQELLLYVDVTEQTT